MAFYAQVLIGCSNGRLAIASYFLINASIVLSCLKVDYFFTQCNSIFLVNFQLDNRSQIHLFEHLHLSRHETIIIFPIMIKTILTCVSIKSN